MAPLRPDRARPPWRSRPVALASLVALVVAVLGAGCGADDDTVGVPAPSPAGASSTTLTPAGAGSVPVTGGSGAADAGSGDPSVSEGSSGAPADPVTPTTAAVTGTPPAIDAAVPTGQLAPVLLRPDLSQQIVLELQVGAGARPAAATVEHVRATLAAATGKPVEVTAGASPPAISEWNSASIRSAADAGASSTNGAGTVVLRLLFVTGTFEGDTGVLGVAVRGDVAAVFVEQTSAAAGLLGDPTAVATSVATHEIGHLLGLVGLYRDTGRADPEHPGHSANTGSVMYWAVESDLITSVLGGSPPRDFDADDLADLRAIAAGG